MPLSAFGLRPSAMVLVLVIGTAGVVRAQQPQPPPRPVFETKAELVLVDVNVVDRESKPVATLKAEDFTLEVNGQPRPIASIQFVSTAPTNVTPATPREAASSSNETETTGRLLLFVVDESSLRVGSSRSILRTAQNLFQRLAPGDLVGLARLPTGVGSVEFTADRQRIVDGLMRVTGGGSNSRVGVSRVYISEAWALESNDSNTFQQAVDRECAGETGPSLEACQNTVESDARQLLIEASARARSTLQGLEALLRSLAQLNTPVNIVMISEGMFVARDRVSMAELGRRAAEARATIHIIRPSQSFFDVEDRGLPNLNSRFFDDGLMSEGLEQVAGQTRGLMTTVTGSGEVAFDRLGRELSGYYLIGFEPTDADRTGKERRIKVEVRPRGLTVRARPTFVIRNDAAATAAAAALTPQQQLGEVLKSPLPVRGLPMRVATYSAVDSGNKIRVVIAAEIGEPATTPAEWPIGLIILDKNDKVVVNRGGNSTLAPASAAGESPRLALTSVVLDPGEYTLRMAAVDDTGRGGSVHHSISAKLNRVTSTISAGDLMLVPQPPTAGDLPRPRPSTVIDNDTVSAMIELTGGDQAALGRLKVALQIADAENGNPLVNVEPRHVQRGPVRAYAATLRLGVLPPGEYVARAVISLPGQPEVRLTRPFRLSPDAMAAAAPPPDLRVPIDPDAPPAPVAPSRIVAPVPRFSAQTILTPAVVQPFLDGLADLYPPSPAVEAVIENARAGNYDAPPDAGGSAEDQLNLNFIRGLGALSRGETAQAAAWFQSTLKGASDFLGAAFYLGATHALSGRDREAIGAWQMALLSENPAAVYPELVDALLRVGDGRQALEVLQDSPAAWTNDNERLRREAIALAMIGDFGGALPILKDQLDNTQNDDQPLLFVALQVLFRLHQQDKNLSPDNLQRFRSYVERHQKLGGPDRAIVETWRRAVLGR